MSFLALTLAKGFVLQLKVNLDIFDTDLDLTISEIENFQMQSTDVELYKLQWCVLQVLI